MTTQEWIKKQCPIAVFYGPSGEGKTELLTTLFKDDDYWPVLYLDLDAGSSTVASYANQKTIVDYRSKAFRREDQSVWEYACEVLKEARTSKHRAIVLEGLTKLRKNLVSETAVNNPELIAANRGTMRLYLPASMQLQVLFGQLDAVQDTRTRRSEGCPIIITLNPTQHTTEVNKKDVKWWGPGLSDNLAEDIMSRSDLFGEVSRPAGCPLRLLVDRTPLNRWRKCRNDEVAKKLQGLADPKIYEIFTTCAEVEARQTAELAAAWGLDTNNDDNEDTTTTTTTED